MDVRFHFICFWVIYGCDVWLMREIIFVLQERSRIYSLAQQLRTY